VEGARLTTRVTPERALAYLADSVVVLFLFLPLAYLVFGASGEAARLFAEERGVPFEELGITRALASAPLLYAAWHLVALPYYALAEGIFGRTPGKAHFGLRVVRHRGGGRPGLLRAGVRSALRVVDGLFFYSVGWFVAMCSPSRRRLGDYAAGTVVLGQELPASRPRDAHDPVLADSPTFGLPGEERAHEDAARRAAGEQGERVVSEALAPLVADGYYLFRGVADRCFGDVDHLLVGPAGLFVVEVKSHRGTVTRDPATGELLRDGVPFERDFYEQVARQTEHLASSLGRAYPIYWTICFTRASLVLNARGEAPQGTCTPGFLREIVLGRPPMLSAAEVDEAARRVASAYGARAEATRRRAGCGRDGDNTRRTYP
jgi:uncharacterized RDD family membrane protein YckC